MEVGRRINDLRLGIGFQNFYFCEMGLFWIHEHNGYEVQKFWREDGKALRQLLLDFVLVKK